MSWSGAFSPRGGRCGLCASGHPCHILRPAISDNWMAGPQCLFLYVFPRAFSYHFIPHHPTAFLTVGFGVAVFGETVQVPVGEHPVADADLEVTDHYSGIWLLVSGKHNLSGKSYFALTTLNFSTTAATRSTPAALAMRSR